MTTQNPDARSPELLAPAGSEESLRAALAAGADAVYFGSTAFSNRMRAKNFGEDRIRDAIRLCHSCGARAYITVNTRVRDKEIPDLLRLADQILGGTEEERCDAVIAADFGAVSEIRRRFPHAVFHASTQTSLMTPADCGELRGMGFSRLVLPRELSLDEIRALADLAHSYDMYLHMDGARLANAAVALGCTFKEMTTDCGVDCLSFGGTKNGLLMGESSVLLNPALDVDMKYRRKQMSQLCSKMRFMAVQFETYLTTDLWRRNAEHSNRMAQLLYESLQGISEVKVMYPVQVNSVFAQLPHEVWTRLLDDYFFYDWDEANDVVRWMCSFDTTEEDINNFVAALKRLL